MRILFVCCTSFLALAMLGANPAPDMDAIQGYWECVTLELDDKQANDEDVKGFRVDITSSKIKFIYVKECETCEFDLKLYPDESPKQLDASAELDGEIQTMKGIYLLDGDSLEICIGEGDGERPSEFKMDKEKHFQVMRFQRKH